MRILLNIVIIILFSLNSFCQEDFNTLYDKIFQKANDFSLTNLDSCEFYSTVALKLANNEVQKINALNSLIGCAYLNSNLEGTKSAITQLEKILVKYKSIPNIETFYGFNNLGAINRMFGDYTKAIKWHLMTLQGVKDLDINEKDKSKLYGNIGGLFFQIGDLEGALFYHRENSRFNHVSIDAKIKNYSYLSRIFLEKQLYDSTLYYASRIKELVTNEEHVNIKKYRTLFKVYFATNDIINCVETLKQLQEKHYPNWKWLDLSLSSDLEYLTGKKHESIKLLKYAISLFENKYPTNKGLDLLEMKLKLAKRSLELNLLKESELILEEYYNNFIDKNFDPVKLYKGGSLDQVTLEFLKLNFRLNNKSKKYIIFNDDEIFDSFIVVLKKLFAGLYFDDSRYIIVKKNLPFIENYIRGKFNSISASSSFDEVSHLLNALSFKKGFNSYLRLGEKNNIIDNEETSNILLKKKEIEGKITSLKKSLATLKGEISSDSESIFKDSIFKMTDQLNSIEAKIPFNFKSDYLFEKLSNTDFILPKGNTYIEFFTSSKNIYVLSINEGKYFPFVVKKDNSIDVLKILKKTISNSEIFYNEIYSLSHQLYKTLIEPCLTEDTKYITFIPDGILSTIPIELLLTDPNDPTSYLVKKYAINYQYSAQLWVQSLTREKRNDYTYDFAGFAPSFSGPIADNVRNCSGTELGYLSCNQNEVQNISQKINYATSLTGLDASLNNFEKIASKARILHLATHSCFELDNPDLSRIYFTDDYYATADLALMNLDNELTVLSACNTGYGAILPGEGVMSLAKGFFQANCHSLLTSQWSIDDCVTPKILEKYYHHLLQGERKDRALQLAKIEFLEENPGLQQHPYFWAGLVQYGDCSPIQFTQTPWQKAWPWLLLLLPLGGGLVWWQRKTA